MKHKFNVGDKVTVTETQWGLPDLVVHKQGIGTTKGTKGKPDSEYGTYMLVDDLNNLYYMHEKEITNA